MIHQRSNHSFRRLDPISLPQSANARHLLPLLVASPAMSFFWFKKTIERRITNSLKARLSLIDEFPTMMKRPDVTCRTPLGTTWGRYKPSGQRAEFASSAPALLSTVTEGATCHFDCGWGAYFLFFLPTPPYPLFDGRGTLTLGRFLNGPSIY